MPKKKKKKKGEFLHHRSSAIHALTDNFLGTTFIKLIRYVLLASVFEGQVRG